MSPAFPADDVLLGWLDDDPARVERHLLQHPEDADRLDRLTALPAAVAARLAEAFVVPEDLAIAIRDAVQGSPSRREAGRVLVDLLGTPWRAAALLWSDAPLGEPPTGPAREAT